MSKTKEENCQVKTEIYKTSVKLFFKSVIQKNFKQIQLLNTTYLLDLEFWSNKSVVS